MNMKPSEVIDPLPFLRAAAFPQTRVSSQTSIATRLVCVCLFCSWLAGLVQVETASIAWGFDDRPFLVPQKGAVYYGAHLLGLLSALGAGVFAFAQRKRPRLRIDAAIALGVLFFTAAIWALFTYSQEEIFSTRIFGATGPFVWFSMILVLAGMDPKAWPAINRTVEWIAYLSAIGAVYSIVTQSGYYHFIGLSKHLEYTIVLAWSGGWTLLNSNSARGFHRLAMCLPLALVIPVGVYAQSRSWIVIAALLGGIFFLGVPTRGAIRNLLPRAIFSVIIAAVSIWILYFVAARVVPEAVAHFDERMLQDSRSQQYVEFFSDVRWDELILGRGPEGTWHWRGVGDYQFIDNQFLFMAFVGGLPILIGYCVLIIAPAMRVLRCQAPREVAAAAWVLLLWALALGGLGTFVSPNLGLISYFMCLCAGRCLGWPGGQEPTKREFENLGRFSAANQPG